MSRTRYYKFEFENGDLKFMTPEEAKMHSDFFNVKITYNGLEHQIKYPPRIHDGFKAGWQPGLGMEVQHYDEYKRICKAKGYEILGNDRPIAAKKEQKAKYITDDAIKSAVQGGAQISGNEAAALKKGINLLFHL